MLALFLLSYYNDCRISYFLIMVKFLQSTSRGQITLPKQWRDKFDTKFYKAVIRSKEIVIIPLIESKDLESELNESWEEYEEGKIISHDEMMKKHGL